MTVAAYRQAVLSGLQEVEDNLSALRILESEPLALLPPAHDEHRTPHGYIFWSVAITGLDLTGEALGLWDGWEVRRISPRTYIKGRTSGGSKFIRQS